MSILLLRDTGNIHPISRLKIVRFSNAFCHSKTGQLSTIQIPDSSNIRMVTLPDISQKFRDICVVNVLCDGGDNLGHVDAWSVTPMMLMKRIERSEKELKLWHLTGIQDLSAVGAQILSIQILKKFEYQTFLNLVLNWSIF